MSKESNTSWDHCTLSVSRCTVAHKISLPLDQKVTFIAGIYHDYVLKVTDSLLLPSTRGFSARLVQTGLFPHRVFFVSHTDSPIMGAGGIGQVAAWCRPRIHHLGNPHCSNNSKVSKRYFRNIVPNINDTANVSETKMSCKTKTTGKDQDI